MISDLAPILESLEFEEYGHVVVTAFERRKDDAELMLTISTGVENQDPVERCVRCRGVVAANVSFQLAYSIQELTDDPALWAFTQPHARLYFSGAPVEQHLCLLGALYSTHIELLADAVDALPFGKGLNARDSLAGGHGLALEGPLPLLQAYQQVLNEHGVTTSIAGERPPKIWNGEQWISTPKDLRLLLVGSTWVVARTFMLHPSQNGAV